MQNETTDRLTRSQLFLIFFKAGCAFGGGPGILAVLEDELVTKRRAVTHDEFLTIYAIGRLVPSGTMTALAVAYGQKFAGLPGTVIAANQSGRWRARAHARPAAVCVHDRPRDAGPGELLRGEHRIHAARLARRSLNAPRGSYRRHDPSITGRARVKLK